MILYNIELRRKDYEILLKETITRKAETMDKKVEEWLKLEIDFLIEQINLLKKYEKKVNIYKGGTI